MLLSVVLAALGSGLLYQYSVAKRSQDYQIENLTTMVALIADRFVQQPEQNQSVYLDLVAQLTGAQIQVYQPNATPEEIKSQLEKSNLTYNVERDQITWWFGRTNQYIQLKLSTVNERVLRAHALLIAAELERKINTPTLAQLQLYSYGELQLADISQLNLDPQFLSRLHRKSVVVDYQPDQSFQVLTPLSDSRVLIMGPLNSFNPLPTSILLMMLGLTATIIIVVSYILVRRMELRLGVIADFVNSLAKGHLSTRTELKGRDQFASLAARVNSMAVQIEELMQSQKEMLQAISHDLRTPIARIRFRLDMLAEDAEDTEVETKTEAIKKDIEELEQLISQVLTHMKLSQSEEVVLQSIEPKAVITNLITEQELAFPQVEFSQNCDTDTSLNADPLMFKRLLQNLISNAAKHCNGEVNIALYDKNGKTRIEVHDDGEGIQAELRTKIFEPFYRIDSSRNRKTGGYGLGLSIIKKITDLHEAKVGVEQSTLGGAMFYVEFPLLSVN